MSECRMEWMVILWHERIAFYLTLLPISMVIKNSIRGTLFNLAQRIQEDLLSHFPLLLNLNMPKSLIIKANKLWKFRGSWRARRSWSCKWMCNFVMLMGEKMLIGVLLIHYHASKDRCLVISCQIPCSASNGGRHGNVSFVPTGNKCCFCFQMHCLSTLSNYCMRANNCSSSFTGADKLWVSYLERQSILIKR